jgi:hypothetical protein
LPIELFDAHSSGCEVGLLVGSAEGRYRGRLLVQSDGHLTWRGILRHPFDGEQVAAADNRGLCLGQLLPAFDPAVGFDGLGK